MTIKHAVGWGLIILAVALSVCVVAKTVFVAKPVEEVSSSELFPVGADSEGEDWYWVLKKEVKDWVAVFQPVGSLVAVFVGLKLKRRGGVASDG